MSRKGPAWERQFCKRLSLWWDGARDDIFWRTHGSGARATSRRKGGKDTAGQHGDVCAACPSGLPFLKLFCVELKKGYNKDTIQNLLDRQPKNAAAQEYAKWIKKAAECCRASDAHYWLIVVRRDQRQPLAIMPRPAFDRIEKFEEEKTHITAAVDLGESGFWDVAVVLLDDLLACLDREAVMRMVS